jgi:hypothetical protein
VVQVGIFAGLIASLSGKFTGLDKLFAGSTQTDNQVQSVLQRDGKIYVSHCQIPRKKDLSMAHLSVDVDKL